MRLNISKINFAKKLFNNQGWFFQFVFFLIIVFRIWILAGIPKAYVPSNYDDLFFAEQAYALLHGAWLGSFTSITLLKVPFYGMFLAFSSLTGLPLFLNENLLFIFACLVLYFSIQPIINNRWVRLLIFAILVFCPAGLLTVWTIRVYREFVYYSLTLLVIAFSIGLFLRVNSKIGGLVLWAAGLGFSMGAFMLTREEGVWIYPSLFLILLGCLWVIWKKSENGKWKRTLILFVPVILWLLPMLIVSSLNYSHYGFWGISEELDPDINTMINTMGRIKTTSWYPFERVTRETLQKAYQASPTLSGLKGELDLALPRWAPASDYLMKMKPTWYLRPYSDYAKEGGMAYFEWALIDAVSSAGYYSTGQYPHELYSRITKELNAACLTGALDCASSMNIPYVGTLENRQIPIIGRMYVDAEQSLMNMDISLIPVPYDPAYWQQYSDNKPDFSYFDMLTNNPVLQPKTKAAGEDILMSGWGFFEKDAAPISFIFKDQAGKHSGDKVVGNLASPDVYTYFQRQGMEIPVTKTCGFSLTLPKGTTQVKALSSKSATTISLDGLTTPMYLVQDGFHIFIDSKTVSSVQPFKDIRLQLMKAKAKFFNLNSGLYRVFNLPFSLLSVICLIGLVVMAVWRKFHPPLEQVVVIVFLAGLFISRLTTLVIIDATTNTPGRAYGASLYLFLYLWIAMSIFSFFSTLAAYRKQNQPQ